MKGIKQVKNYRLLREIGKGLTGTVYEAVDDSNGKKFAIKSIPSSKLENKRILENFKKELKLIHSLNHNNILKIIGLEKTVNNTYLVLEYCNGGNLNDYLMFKHQTCNELILEATIQFFLRQLIQGIDYMLKYKLIHRDLKLENILLNFSSVSNTLKPNQENTKIDLAKVDIFDSILKIGDLSYAKELEGNMANSTVCGVSKINYDENIDLLYNDKIELWSLGAITYELLFGTQLVNDRNLIKKNQISDKFKISLEMISFINCLLNFNSDLRIPWEKIGIHPFIVNNISTFTYIELEKTVNEDINTLMSKKSEFFNFIWVDFKNDYFRHIDKIIDNNYKPNEERSCNQENKESDEIIIKKNEEIVIAEIDPTMKNKIMYDQKGDIGLIINTNIEGENFENNQYIEPNSLSPKEFDDLIKKEEEKKKEDQLINLNECQLPENSLKKDDNWLNENLNNLDDNKFMMDKEKELNQKEILTEEQNFSKKVNLTNISNEEKENSIQKSEVNNNIDSQIIAVKEDKSANHNVLNLIEGNIKELKNETIEIKPEKQTINIKDEKEMNMLSNTNTINVFNLDKLNTEDQHIQFENREIKTEKIIEKERKKMEDDTANILKDLLNKEFPISPAQVINEKPSKIDESDDIEENNQCDGHSSEDLWEIISSKSIDNLNIVVDGTFKENIIIFDYFK